MEAVVMVCGTSDAHVVPGQPTLLSQTAGRTESLRLRNHGRRRFEAEISSAVGKRKPYYPNPTNEN